MQQSNRSALPPGSQRGSPVSCRLVAQSRTAQINWVDTTAKRLGRRGRRLCAGAGVLPGSRQITVTWRREPDPAKVRQSNCMVLRQRYSDRRSASTLARFVRPWERAQRLGDASGDSTENRSAARPLARVASGHAAAPTGLMSRRSFNHLIRRGDSATARRPSGLGS